jgi:hypothetical protein
VAVGTSKSATSRTTPLTAFTASAACPSSFRASPTDAPKPPRGKLTAGLPRGTARALLQWARENAAARETFAARTLLRHHARQSCRSGCRAHYLTPRAVRIQPPGKLHHRARVSLALLRATHLAPPLALLVPSTSPPPLPTSPLTRCCLAAAQAPATAASARARTEPSTPRSAAATVEILGPKLVAHIRFQKFLRNLKAHVCEPM